MIDRVPTMHHSITTSDASAQDSLPTPLIASHLHRILLVRETLFCVICAFSCEVFTTLCFHALS